MTTTTPATVGENSLYQQLRGHLANLKLTASAATVSDGMELTGLGFWVEPYTAVR